MNATTCGERNSPVTIFTMKMSAEAHDWTYLHFPKNWQDINQNVPNPHKMCNLKTKDISSKSTTVNPHNPVHKTIHASSNIVQQANCFLLLHYTTMLSHFQAILNATSEQKISLCIP